MIKQKANYDTPHQKDAEKKECQWASRRNVSEESPSAARHSKVQSEALLGKPVPEQVQKN